ncbi:MAG: hypothetical protein Q8L55_07525, partial [Phycisphaerales bacterium]|nr:hypothetical protein [Phycisphaerales bacterium]
MSTTTAKKSKAFANGAAAHARSTSVTPKSIGQMAAMFEDLGLPTDTNNLYGQTVSIMLHAAEVMNL